MLNAHLDSKKVNILRSQDYPCCTFPLLNMLVGLPFVIFILGMQVKFDLPPDVASWFMEYSDHFSCIPLVINMSFNLLTDP